MFANSHLIELEQQGMEDWRVRKTIKEELRSINNGNGRRLRQAIKNIASASGIARNSARY